MRTTWFCFQFSFSFSESINLIVNCVCKSVYSTMIVISDFFTATTVDSTMCVFNCFWNMCFGFTIHATRHSVGGGGVVVCDLVFDWTGNQSNSALSRVYSMMQEVAFPVQCEARIQCMEPLLYLM